VKATSPSSEVEQMVSASLQKDGEGMADPQKDVVMCIMLAKHLAPESEAKWVPPHEFSYPSDEEIMPNPKASFTKMILPRLGHVRSWFRGSERNHILKKMQMLLHRASASLRGEVHCLMATKSL
jgi:hypothetical protein